MKSKSILGLMLLGAVVNSQQAVASTGAEKATEQVLIGVAIIAGSSITKMMDMCDSCWTSVGLKEWQTTLEPGDGTSRNRTTTLLSLNAGYGKWFINMSTNVGGDRNLNTNYANSSSAAGDIYHAQSSQQIGYLVTPEFSFALGIKRIHDSFSPVGNSWSDVVGVADTPAPYLTYGAMYSHKVSDTRMTINALVTSGTSQLQVDNPANYTGVTSGTSNLLSYEVGGTYIFSESSSLSFYYRVEQYDALLPTAWYAPYNTAPIANLQLTKMKLSGPGVGYAFSF